MWEQHVDINHKRGLLKNVTSGHYLRVANATCPAQWRRNNYVWVAKGWLARPSGAQYLYGFKTASHRSYFSFTWTGTNSFRRPMSDPFHADCHAPWELFQSLSFHGYVMKSFPSSMTLIVCEETLAVVIALSPAKKFSAKTEHSLKPAESLILDYFLIHEIGLPK